MHKKTAPTMKMSPTKKPMRLSSAAQPMSSVAMIATAYSAPQIQFVTAALLRYIASMRPSAFSRFSSVRGCGSEEEMRSPRSSSSHVTSNSSAIAGSMEISGQDAPVSQLETVLLETPRRSATSCWVSPLDLRRMAKKSPMDDFMVDTSR